MSKTNKLRKPADNLSAAESPENEPKRSEDGVVVAFAPGDESDPARLDEKWVEGCKQAEAEAASARAIKAAAEAEAAAAAPEIALAAQAEAENAANARAKEEAEAAKLADLQDAVAKGDVSADGSDRDKV